MRLSTILKIKIFCTVCFWSLPLLFYSLTIAKPLGFPEPHPRIWVHLLGAAFFALLLGYVLGLRDYKMGKDARNTLKVGIISNGLASLILWIFGIAGTWSEWGRSAQIYMWGSALMTLLITIALIAKHSQAGVIANEN